MILKGVGHQMSCLEVCYANDPPNRGYTTPAPAFHLTTSLQGELPISSGSDHLRLDPKVRLGVRKFSVFFKHF